MPASGASTRRTTATTDYNKADEATDGEFSNLVNFGDFEGFSGEPNGWYLNATGTHLADNQDVVSNFINTLENDGTNVGVYSSGGPTSDWLTITNNMTLSVIEWTSEDDQTAAVPCPTTIFSDSNGKQRKVLQGSVHVQRDRFFVAMVGGQQWNHRRL